MIQNTEVFKKWEGFYEIIDQLKDSEIDHKINFNSFEKCKILYNTKENIKPIVESKMRFNDKMKIIIGIGTNMS